MWYKLTGWGFYCAQHKWTLISGLNKKKNQQKKPPTKQNQQQKEKKAQNQKKKTKDFPKTISKGKAWNILSTPFPFWQDWEWLPWILWFVGEGGVQVMADSAACDRGPLAGNSPLGHPEHLKSGISQPSTGEWFKNPFHWCGRSAITTGTVV